MTRLSGRTRPSPDTDAGSDLTIPRSESRTCYRLLSEYLKAQYALLRRLPRLFPWRDDLEQVVSVAATLARDNPGALFSVLKRPTVGGPLRCLVSMRSANSSVTGPLAGLLSSQFAWELAADGVRVDLGPIANPPTMLVALDAGQTARLKDGLTTLMVRDGALFDATGETALMSLDQATHPVVWRSVVLALTDNNPRASYEAHPDKSGNQLDLGGRPVDEWVKRLSDAMTLVEGFVPEVAAEISLVARQLVPVGYDAEQHLSASYQEVIGNIYLTLHPDPLTLAEALVHEFSHNKLNLLFSLDRVLENAFSPLFPSPIRPDPRPLHGVLLAVHAFLPVELMYAQMLEGDHPLARHPRFESRRAAIRQNNQDATDVLLQHGIPTPRGEPLLAEIERWNTHFAGV